MNKVYIILGILLLLVISGCNKMGNNKTNYKSVSDSNYSTEDYKSYMNDDGIFKVTVFVEAGPYFHDEHINIFSTLEYVGDEDSIKIWHGIPYFSYTIFDGEDYYSEGLVETILTSTVLEKGEIYILPFKKSGGWSSDCADAKFWEDYYMDKELKLPCGEYLLTAYCNFGLTEDDFSYENRIEIEIEVE